MEICKYTINSLSYLSVSHKNNQEQQTSTKPKTKTNWTMNKQNHKETHRLHLAETSPRFSQRNSNIWHSESLLRLKVYELHDHNATIPKQFTEPNNILNHKQSQAESRDRTDKCFLLWHQMCAFRIKGTHPVAGPESPLQGIRLRSLITDYSDVISQGLNQKTL